LRPQTDWDPVLLNFDIRHQQDQEEEVEEEVGEDGEVEEQRRG